MTHNKTDPPTIQRWAQRPALAEATTRGGMRPDWWMDEIKDGGDDDGWSEREQGRFDRLKERAGDRQRMGDVMKDRWSGPSRRDL